MGVVGPDMHPTWIPRGWPVAPLVHWMIVNFGFFTWRVMRSEAQGPVVLWSLCG